MNCHSHGETGGTGRWPVPLGKFFPISISRSWCAPHIGLVFFSLLLPGVGVAQPARRTDVVLEQLSRLAEGQRQLGERLARVEEGQRQLGERLSNMEEGQRQLREAQSHLGERFARVEEGQQQLKERFDNLWTLVAAGFGVLITGMFALVGFVLWDRRTALAPAVRQMEDLQERERRLEEVLRRYAAKSPELAEELRKVGIL